MEIHVRAPLFDRLVDLQPGSTAEPRPLRTLDRRGLRESVRRELERLLNTRSSLPVDRLEEREELTVLEYGIPDLSAFSAADQEDQRRLARVVARAVAAYEPRLREVHAVFEHLEDNGRAAALRIEARLAVDEVSEPIAFPTLLSVKGGEVLVRLAEEEPALRSERR
jgi:type VI secretion system protein ImpF